MLPLQVASVTCGTEVLASDMVVIVHLLVSRPHSEFVFAQIAEPRCVKLCLFILHEWKHGPAGPHVVPD